MDRHADCRSFFKPRYTYIGPKKIRNFYELQIKSLILLPTRQAVQPSTPYLSAAIKFDANQAENASAAWILISWSFLQLGWVAQFSAARGSLRIFGCRWDRTFLMVNPPRPLPIRLRERRYFGQIFGHQNSASWHGFYDDKKSTKYRVFSSLEVALHPIIVLFSGTAQPAFDMFTEAMCHENWQPLLPCLTQSYLNGKKFKN